ncbi:MAG: hypothetical protein V4819_10880 [Verrucomicrobiota bacterium]
MKHPLIAVGLTLVGIAIGFVAGHLAAVRGADFSKQSPPPERTVSARRVAAAGGKDYWPAGSSRDLAGDRDLSGLSATNAFALVEATDAIDGDIEPLDKAKKTYECEVMLERLPLSVLEQLILLSQKSKLSKKVASHLFARYAVRDWQKAMAWVAENPDVSSLQFAAVRAVADSRPDLAQEVLQEALKNIQGNSEWGASFQAQFALSAAFARQGKDPFFRFIDTLPSGIVANVISNALEKLPRDDIPGFLEEVGKRTKEGKVEDFAMRNIMHSLAVSDPALAIRWIDKMEPGYPRTSCETGFTSMLVRNGRKDEALAFVKNAMVGHAGEEMKYFQYYASEMAGDDIGFVRQVAGLLPPGMEVTEKDVDALEGSLGNKDIVSFSTLINSPQGKAAYLEGAIARMAKDRGANESDFRLLENRLESLGLEGESASLVDLALAAARGYARQKR